MIYNYTLGVFFQYQKNAGYKKISLEPKIDLDEMGELVGYTQSDLLSKWAINAATCKLQEYWLASRKKEEWSYVYGNILHPNAPIVFENEITFSKEAFNKAKAAVNNESFANSRLIDRTVL
jgi:hypothetical protein